MSDELRDYRIELVKADQKSVESFDRTLITLSGGAITISVALLKDVVGDGNIRLTWALISAWAFWAIALSLVLLSFYLGSKSLRYAMRQVDNQTIATERPGGWYSIITEFANALALASVIIGVVLFLVFVTFNVKGIFDARP
jgi:hypothetical protein